jgi:broad-specificity NMP kinase
MVMNTRQHNALLRRFLAVRTKRTGVCVCLCGEAGIGKSFVASQLVRELACAHTTISATAMAREIIRAVPSGREKLTFWTERTLESSQAGYFVPSDAVAIALLEIVTALAPFVLVVEDLYEASSSLAELVFA